MLGMQIAVYNPTIMCVVKSHPYGIDDLHQSRTFDRPLPHNFQKTAAFDKRHYHEALLSIIHEGMTRHNVRMVERLHCRCDRCEPLRSLLASILQLFENESLIGCIGGGHFVETSVCPIGKRTDNAIRSNGRGFFSLGCRKFNCIVE